MTLSESAEELAAGASSHGWSLGGIEVLELTSEGQDLAGDDVLTMYHPSEVELTETTKKVLDGVDRLKPQRMVFDSLSELRLLAQSSLRYRRQILALKQFFTGRHCTVLLLDDRTAEGADRQLQSIAHGVISLEHKAPNYGPALRQLQVVKFRGSDFRSGMQDFRIRRSGLEVFPRLTAAEHSAVFVRECVASGVARLDQLFGGGIDRGTATLLSAHPARASRPWRCSSPPPRQAGAITLPCSPWRSRASCFSTAATVSASRNGRPPRREGSPSGATTPPKSRRVSSRNSSTAPSRTMARGSWSSTA